MGNYGRDEAYNRMVAKKRAGLGYLNRVPIDQVRPHIMRLIDQGHTLRDIADAAHVARGTVHNVVERKNPTINWRNASALLGVRLLTPQPLGRHEGRRVPATGTVRRLRALHAVGYSAGAVHSFMGDDAPSRPSYLSKLMGGAATVYPKTAADVKQAYDKLSTMHPLESGYATSAHVVVQCKDRARAYSWAPPHCWDEDTIDDPLAWPEWTGHCGSAKGYRIHKRDGIPQCPPCIAAYSKERAAEIRHFDLDAFDAARHESKMSYADIAAELKLAEETVRRWGIGRTKPQGDNVDALTDLLGLPPGALWEGTPDGD